MLLFSKIISQRAKETTRAYFSFTEGQIRSSIITMPRIKNGPATYTFPTTNRAIKPNSNNI